MISGFGLVPFKSMIVPPLRSFTPFPPPPIGNGVGDACEMDATGDGVLDVLDSDGDGVPDMSDAYSSNYHIHNTDFTKHMIVALSSSRRTSPRWSIKGNVSIVQRQVECCYIKWWWS